MKNFFGFKLKNNIIFNSAQEPMRIRNSNTVIVSWFLWDTDVSHELTDLAINKYYKMESEYKGKELVAGDTYFENGILKKVSTFKDALGLLYIYI